LPKVTQRLQGRDTADIGEEKKEHDLVTFCYNEQVFHELQEMH
jgi:hypothetical protein